MLHRCKTESCENYDKLVEVNMTDDGQYIQGARLICDKCGIERVLDIEASYRKPKFAIDELALGTKRMFDKPKG